MQRYLFIAAFFAVSFAHAQSPYISRVWEYCPAPGQFVNSMPEYEQGDDANDMRMKAEEAIADNNQGMISLGGWGGYVVFGFDHMIINVPNAKDLLVLGNAFEGAAEPGIVMVSYDANGNGKPDDEWYELAGSEYSNPQTIHDFCREAIYMQNCLISYVEALIKNDTTILFMRRADDVNQPFITIEIYHGELMQAYHRFNKDCTPDEAAWILAYCERHGIKANRYQFNAAVDELF